MISEVNRLRILGIVAEITLLAILLMPGNAVATSTVWDESSGSPLPFTWDYSNFEGFNVSGTGTESLGVVQTNLGAASGKTRTVEKSGLTYGTALALKEYEVSRNRGLPVENALDSTLIKRTSGNYYAELNLFGESYIALNGKPNKLAKLLFEQKGNERKTLGVGETWDMGGGWTLSAQSIDAKATPRQVWLTLSSNGIKKDDKVLVEGQVYTYVEKNVSGEPDVPLFVTYIDSIFAGAVSDLLQLKYTWAISEATSEIRAGNNYGVFTVTSISENGLNLENNRSITLASNATINLAGSIKFKVIDNSSYLKFYPVSSTDSTDISEAIQAVGDYFSGIITKEEAIGKITVILPPMPVPTPPPFQPENITKLEIIPSYASSRLQVGESKAIVVTVRNKENNPVTVAPKVVIPPYSTYVIEKEWIVISPQSAEIPAGGSQRFTVNVSVPKTASTGYYKGQIAFTDEVISTSSPELYPNYVHYLTLSIDVWKMPIVRITPSYISDQLEAGKEYDYEILLKNTGDVAVAINPIVGSDMYYYGPYGTPPALTDDAITITAPESIPANATEAVKVHVRVPVDSRGYYSGWIDLGIDDTSIREGEGRVNLNFNIWKQPVEPFFKNFSLKEASPITIEVTGSGYSIYPYPILTGQVAAKEPSFEISLEGAAGTVVLNLTKTVMKGRVGMGEVKVDSTDTYQEMDTQHIETYKANASAGDWKLKVLPRNTQSFEYSITIG